MSPNEANGKQRPETPNDTNRALYHLVFFDVDSTLVTIEGIDVLAGGDPEVAALTAAAMNGTVPLDEVYARRLERIRPTRAAIAALAARYLESLVEGAADTIAALQDGGALVHLVTAGIEDAVLPLAARLNIPARALHAVKVRFDADGGYVDYDRRSFLTKPKGKELVVRDIRARTHGKAAFVGDGVSDLEAREAVDLFIGFGGVAIRPKVQENADVFVTSMRDVRRQLLEERGTGSAD
jgi:phosphoserine phosphatase